MYIAYMYYILLPFIWFSDSSNHFCMLFLNSNFKHFFFFVWHISLSRVPYSPLCCKWHFVFFVANIPSCLRITLLYPLLVIISILWDRGWGQALMITSTIYMVEKLIICKGARNVEVQILPNCKFSGMSECTN